VTMTQLTHACFPGSNNLGVRAAQIATSGNSISINLTQAATDGSYVCEQILQVTNAAGQAVSVTTAFGSAASCSVSGSTITVRLSNDATFIPGGEAPHTHQALGTTLVHSPFSRA
jgi:hypothetical protein